MDVIQFNGESRTSLIRSRRRRRPTGRDTLLVFSLLVSALSLIAGRASGDSIQIFDPLAYNSPVNLSAGTNDWAHYGIPNDTTSDGDVTLAFDHRSSTNFSNVSGVNGSPAGYDTTSSAAPLMTWTGGTPDAVGSSRSWVFNSNDYAADGLNVTYQAAPGETEFNFYAYTYTDALNVSLPVSMQVNIGSLSATDTTGLPVFYNVVKQVGDYVIDVTNSSSASESISLTFSQTAYQNGPAGNGSNVGILGVTATTVVPEPTGTLTLAVLSLPTLIRGRRKRKGTESTKGVSTEDGDFGTERGSLLESPKPFQKKA